MEQLPTEILHLIVQQCFQFEDFEETVHALSSLACSCWTLCQAVQHHFPLVCRRLKEEGCPLQLSNLRLACLLYQPPDEVELVPDRLVIAVDTFGDFVYPCCTIPKIGVDACFTYCEETDTVCWQNKRCTESAYWVKVYEEERERQDPVLNDGGHVDCYVRYYDINDNDLWTYTGGEGKMCVFYCGRELRKALGKTHAQWFVNWLGTRFPKCVIEVPDIDAFHVDERRDIFCKKIEKVKEADNSTRERALTLCKKVRQCSSRLEQDEYQKLLDNIEQLLSATKSK